MTSRISELRVLFKEIFNLVQFFYDQSKIHSNHTVKHAVKHPQYLKSGTRENETWQNSTVDCQRR